MGTTLAILHKSRKIPVTNDKLTIFSRQYEKNALHNFII